MNKITLWVFTGLIVISVPCVMLMIYAGSWLTALTYALIGVSSYFGRQNALRNIENQEIINRRIEEILNDPRR